MADGDGFSIPCIQNSNEIEKNKDKEDCWKQLYQELLQKDTTSSSEDKIGCFGRPGSEIDQKVEFKNKFGEKISAVPVVIDFNRVFKLKQTKDGSSVISGVSNRDLLHAVCGLYDISLPDMESETIYNTVCAKWARTIVLVQDVKDAVNEMMERSIKKKSKVLTEEDKKKVEEIKSRENAWKSKVDEKEDIFKEEEEVNLSAFIDVFSDTDEDDDEEESDDDEEDEDGSDEDYTKGIHTFISGTFERRKLRENCDCLIPDSAVGIENRILGCVTFEKKFIQQKERIIHLTLISVRPRYRNYKIGRYLLSKCISPAVTGQYEAVVVHADNSAVDFFKKYGFSSDVILNTKWDDIADAFTNCTLMSYFPAFSGHKLLYTDVSAEIDAEMYDIDQELEMWQKKSKQAYQGQLSCAMKFRNEILQLKHIIKSQNELLKNYLAEHNASKELIPLENGVLNLQLDKLQKSFKESVKPLPDDELTLTPPAEPVTLESSNTSNVDIISRFVQAMEMDSSIKVFYTVTSLLKSKISPKVQAKFDATVAGLGDPNMVTHMYYCGSLDKSSRLPHILDNGFTQDDFSPGEFGLGLYFSRYPSKAAQFSVLGKILEVRVGLGKVETVMKQDRTRRAPSQGFDAIFTPGRLYRQGDDGNGAMLCQEYVVFNANQVLPLWLISYSVYPDS